MINLVKGSIFDSKCDLLIIPCNSFGGVSNGIRSDIMANDLPMNYFSINAGNVKFIQCNDTFTNSMVLGYAATVDGQVNKSNEKVIKTIVRTIKNFCLKQSLSKINMPLLGTGAGALKHDSSYKIIKDEFENDSNLDVYVYVIDDNIYNTLLNLYDLEKNNHLKHPRVFISYTSNNDHNKRKWVKELVENLRKNGIDAKIDIYNLKPGQNLPQWMTDELIKADKVLLICDEEYAKKADNNKGGVGWETMIIQGDMLVHQNQDKYIAIERENNLNKNLPVYVQSKLAMVWTDDDNYDDKLHDLLIYLYDCNIEPPLGPIPDYIKQMKNI